MFKQCYVTELFHTIWKEENNKGFIRQETDHMSEYSSLQRKFTGVWNFKGINYVRDKSLGFVPQIQTSLNP